MHEYLLLVIRNHEDIDALMAPWGKGRRVPGHWGELVTDQEKECFLHLYKQEELAFAKDFPEDEWPDWIKKGTEPDLDEAYKDYTERGDLEEFSQHNHWKKDPEDQWRWWIEWEANPQGVWDWWEIGGGWCSGALNLKECSRTEPHANYYEDVWMDRWTEHLKTHPRASDRGYKGDVTNLEELDCFHAVLVDSEWLEVEGKVYQYIKGLPDDVELVCIDCHV